MNCSYESESSLAAPSKRSLSARTKEEEEDDSLPIFAVTLLFDFFSAARFCRRSGYCFQPLLALALVLLETECTKEEEEEEEEEEDVVVVVLCVVCDIMMFRDISLLF